MGWKLRQKSGTKFLKEFYVERCVGADPFRESGPEFPKQHQPTSLVRGDVAGRRPVGNQVENSPSNLMSRDLPGRSAMGNCVLTSRVNFMTGALSGRGYLRNGPMMMQIYLERNFNP